METGLKPEYRMLGHTIDHRLRISLGAPTGAPIKEGIVRAVIDDDGWPSQEVIRAVQKAGDTMLEELVLPQRCRAASVPCISGRGPAHPAVPCRLQLRGDLPSLRLAAREHARSLCCRCHPGRPGRCCAGLRRR
ncbi:hypothetical protein ACFQ3Z_44475 [Streptomyces nogalater]